MTIGTPNRGAEIRCVAVCVTTTLAAVFFAFAPHLWLMRTYLPGTYQWDRAHSYLLQCEHPFRHDIEPAMLARPLVPIVCFLLRLHGRAPLVMPWIGVVTLVAYTVVLLRRCCPDSRAVYGGAFVLTATSAILIPLHWLGLNDAWVWLALLVVSYSPSGMAVAIACLFAPWVDERFVIGLPVALAVCHCNDAQLFRRNVIIAAILLVPYAVLRSFLMHSPEISSATRHFLAGQFQATVTCLPVVPFAWWMGLRLAWVPIAFAIYRFWRVLLGPVVLTAVVSLCLASDLSRSIAILLPAALLGITTWIEQRPQAAPRETLILGVGALCVPAAHVVFTKIDLISPLPLEVYRLLAHG